MGRLQFGITSSVDKECVAARGGAIGRSSALFSTSAAGCNLQNNDGPAPVPRDLRLATGDLADAGGSNEPHGVEEAGDLVPARSNRHVAYDA